MGLGQLDDVGGAGGVCDGGESAEYSLTAAMEQLGDLDEAPTEDMAGLKWVRQPKRHPSRAQPVNYTLNRKSTTSPSAIT